MLQKLVNPFIHFWQGKLLSGSTRQKPYNHCPDRRKESRFQSCLFIYQAPTQRKRLFQQQCFFDIDALRFFIIWQVLLSFFQRRCKQGAVLLVCLKCLAYIAYVALQIFADAQQDGKRTSSFLLRLLIVPGDSSVSFRKTDFGMSLSISMIHNFL